jgi:hypothetical protein
LSGGVPALLLRAPEKEQFAPRTPSVPDREQYGQLALQARRRHKRR